MSNLKKFFRRHAFRFYDPSQEQLQHALQTTLSATIAIILTLIFRWPESPWLIMASVYILQIKPSRSLTQKMSLQATTGIIAALLGLLAWKTNKIFLFKIIVISLVGFGMVIVSAAGQQFAVAGLFITIWTIIAYSSNVIHPYQRAILLLSGSSIAITTGLLPLMRLQYRLQNTKMNFWYSCSHYWQERISATPNPLYCHSYRFYLLVCLDKLNQLLPAEQSQIYAYCFELICDVLLQRDNLLAHCDDIFRTEINYCSHLIMNLLSSQYTPQYYENLILTLHQIQQQLSYRHQVSGTAKEQLIIWLHHVNILANHISKGRKSDIA